QSRTLLLRVSAGRYTRLAMDAPETASTPGSRTIGRLSLQAPGIMGILQNFACRRHKARSKRADTHAPQFNAALVPCLEAYSKSQPKRGDVRVNCSSARQEGDVPLPR